MVKKVGLEVNLSAGRAIIMKRSSNFDRLCGLSFLSSSQRPRIQIMISHDSQNEPKE